MISVIGMGPGHVKYVTDAAVIAIQSASQVIAFGRIAETAEQIVTPVIRVARVDEVLALLTNHGHTAILASGDPGFYGILDYLQNKGIVVDEVIPGISSIQYFMAKLKKSWHAATFVSLHGRDGSLEAVKHAPRSLILTDKTNTPHTISKRLQADGMTGTLYIGYDLSYNTERIICRAIGDDVEESGTISLVLVEHAMD